MRLMSHGAKTNRETSPEGQRCEAIFAIFCSRFREKSEFKNHSMTIRLHHSRNLLPNSRKYFKALPEGATHDRVCGPFETVNLFVGRPFQAVVTAKNGQFRRPKKGVLHFSTASSGLEILGNSKSGAYGTGRGCVEPSALMGGWHMECACYLALLKVLGF